MLLYIHWRLQQMIEYKLDHKPNSVATSHIKDMDSVLREIANSYEVLLDVIDQQESALSSPTINNFRNQLKERVLKGIDMSNAIVEDSRKLVVISDQASKQLQAIEEHFSSALEKHDSKPNRNNYTY